LRARALNLFQRLLQEAASPVQGRPRINEAFP